MRRAALAVLTTVVVGCSGTPPPGAEGEASDVFDGASAGEASSVEGAGEPDPRVRSSSQEDPLLTQARAQIRQGRVSSAMQAKLAASQDPDHRHAARLLQQVAGATPAPILSRARDGDRGEMGPKPAPGLEPPAEEPAPLEPDRGGAKIEPEVEPRAEPEPEPEPPAGVPEVEDFEPGTPAHAWFSDAPIGPERAEPDAGERDPRSWPEFGPERSILLRERAPEEPDARPGAPRRYPEVARLVILTSLALSPGQDGRSATLEFAGAGGIELDVLPIDDYHLRLSVVGAGAVPGFLAARPALEGLEVVEVSRYERIVDVELEHGPGWVLAGVETRDNGAAATLVYIEPEPAPTVEPGDDGDDADALTLDEDGGDEP